VSRHPLKRPFRSEPCLPRPLAAEHRRLGLADHLHVAERELEVVGAEVEVVEAERLLIRGRVLVAREGEHGRRVVEHVVAADLVRAVGESIRVLVAGGSEQQLGRVGRPAGNSDDVRGVRFPLSCTVQHDLGHRLTACIGVEGDRLRVCQQGDVRVLERRPDGDHLGIRLRMDQAGEAVAVLTADAATVRHVLLVEQNAAGRVEGSVAGRDEIVGELLDARLVRDGGERVGGAGRRLRRVLPSSAVHLVELLGLLVVGLQLVISDRPGGRDAVVVPELAKVLGAQAVERRAEQLGRPADEVEHLRSELLALLVVPGVL
jgi:hypothetical protein